MSATVKKIGTGLLPELMEGLGKLASVFHYVLQPSAESLRYAIQVGASVVLSVMMAFYFHIEDPFWAGTAAIIVANRVQGQILSKSISRILGTLIGTVAAIFLTALFSQASDLFILCFALWMGLCTYVGSIMRNFRTYSAALSGYTAAIIVMSSASAPDQILQVALARATAVVCGIVATATMSLVFARGTSAKGLENKIENVFDQTCGLVRDASQGKVDQGFERNCYKVVRELSTIPSLIEFAALESSKVRRNVLDLEHVTANLMHALTAAWAFSRNSLVRNPLQDESGSFKQLRAEAAQLAEKMAAFTASASEELIELGRLIGFFGRNVRRYTRELIERTDEQAYRQLIAVKNLAKSLDQLSVALEGWNAYSSERILAQQEQITYDRDHKTALINGFRSFCAVLIAGILWVECAWPSGFSVMEMLAIGCSIYATMLQPQLAAASYLIGVSIGCLISLICYVLILPQIDGFPMLAVVLFVVIGLIVLHIDPTRPKFASRATTTATFFLVSLHLSNPMTYDVASFTNRAMSMLCGIALSAVAFNLIFPVSPQFVIRQSLIRLCQEIRSLASGQEKVSHSIWESRVYDRLTRVISYAEIQQTATWLLIEDYFAMIRVGVEIIALNHLAQAEKTAPKLKESIRSFLECLRNLGTGHEDLFGKLTAMPENLLARTDEDASEKRSDRMAVVSMREIAHLMNKHRHVLAEAHLNL